MMRIGYGEDIHRLESGGPLRLFGIDIPANVHTLAHSDGDCAYHAIADAILGALSLRDIGYYFPDNEEETAGMDSEIILRKVLEMMEEEGYMINNIDVLVTLERPRLSPYIDECINHLAEVLGIRASRVAIKAMTNEGLGAIGEGLAIRVVANVLLEEVFDE